MSEKQIIPIVFATDDGYAPYLGVALHSLIQHIKSEHEYQVHIFYTRLTKEHQRRLQSMETAQVSISFVDLTDKTQEFTDFSDKTYVTVESLYRFLIPELLPQAKKVLYLDCDIVVLDDVSTLYQLDLQDNLLGVADIALEKDMKYHFQNVLQLGTEQGFNAGVLLLNTEKMQEEKIKEKGIACLQEDWVGEKKYKYQDQDMLNLFCKGKTITFPMNWNFEWCFDATDNTFELTPETRILYDKAKEDLKLIHFTSPVKPWSAAEYQYADLFWNFARQTMFYEEILLKEMKKKPKNIQKFPWRNIEAGSVVVIYGAGVVGQNYLEQIALTSYCHICAICDKNAKNILTMPLPVITKEELSQYHYDYIAIAVREEKVAEAVKTDLLALGIEESKLVWQ